ncbi:MAG: hypothetical protein KGJ52_09380 [Gammaproteobacteria bacterium]|nr:hypothetical protein [Gammaproteobacteria bacterium]
MVEFAVAAGVLATLLVGMPVICRYHELQAAAIVGARRAAFENSWQPAGTRRGGVGLIRRDLFPTTGDSGQILASHIDASESQEQPRGLAGQAERGLLAPFNAAAFVQPGFDLRAPVLNRSDFAVALSRPNPMPQPFDGISLALQERYALMGEDWASSGPGQVAARSGGLVITRAFSPNSALIGLGTRLLSIVEPAFREFCPGQVDPERVPADRLGQGMDHDSASIGSWSPAC